MFNRTQIICAIGLATLVVATAGCGAKKRSSTSATAAAASNPSQSSPSGTSSAQHPFNLASSLDGKTVLPHRIHWVALPALPKSQLREVDFLIDGKQAWVERKLPYDYADDGGFLVTSFLKPGEHRFSVRAIPLHGQPATDTVTARVLPAPQVPGALAGTWQRTISDTSSAPPTGTKSNPTGTLTPPGTYKITFDRRWIHDEYPCTTSPCRFVSSTQAGNLFNSDWNPGPSTFHVQGGVTFQVFKDTERLGPWWCQTWGPAATYTWSVSGNTLKLAPVGGHDACAIRGFVWSGTWTRAG